MLAMTVDQSTSLLADRTLSSERRPQQAGSYREVWLVDIKPAPTIFARIRNAPLTRRVFFRIRFTPYEGSHLENHP